MCQLVAAMCAIYVGSGSNLWFRQIHSSVVKNHANDVASLVGMALVSRDIGKDDPADAKVGRIFTSVCNELRWCQSAPDRREPFAPEMLDCTRKLAVFSASTSSLESALADWCEICMLAGVRKSEWAQDKDKLKDPAMVELNLFNDPTAFCINDVEIQTVDRTRLSGLQCLLVLHISVQKLWLTFCTQKNGDNGEKLSFVRNPNVGGHCVVVAVHRVLCRFEALVGSWNLRIPLSVCKANSGNCLALVMSRDIETSVHVIAEVTCNFNPRTRTNCTELMRWSAHSLRVEACVLVHAFGCSTTQIKWLLHWRSDAVVVCLRNISMLADVHHQTLD